MVLSACVAASKGATPKTTSSLTRERGDRSLHTSGGHFLQVSCRLTVEVKQCCNLRRGDGLVCLQMPLAMFEAQFKTPRGDWNPPKFDPKLTVQNPCTKHYYVNQCVLYCLNFMNK